MFLTPFRFHDLIVPSVSLSFSLPLPITSCRCMVFNLRENHSEIERRRRTKMTAYITELSEMVPTCNALARKPDKLTILRMAVTHMKSLKGSGNTSTDGTYKPSFLTDQVTLTHKHWSPYIYTHTDPPHIHTVVHSFRHAQTHFCMQTHLLWHTHTLFPLHSFIKTLIYLHTLILTQARTSSLVIHLRTQTHTPSFILTHPHAHLHKSTCSFNQSHTRSLIHKYIVNVNKCKL